MFARTLRLDCPRGVAGCDGFKTEGPTRLPEALRAIRAGKLPRLAGLTAVRADRQFEFKLHAEAWAVASAKLPPADDDAAGRAVVEHRLNAVRDLRKLTDDLFAAFLAVRAGGRWGDTLARMQRWLELPAKADAARAEGERPFAEVG